MTTSPYRPSPQDATDAAALQTARPTFIIATPRSLMAMLALSQCPAGLRAVRAVVIDEVWVVSVGVGVPVCLLVYGCVLDI